MLKNKKEENKKERKIKELNRSKERTLNRSKERKLNRNITFLLECLTMFYCSRLQPN
jgi:hypothetical protein